MFTRSIALILTLLLTGKAFSQIKAGEKAADLHITNWIQNVPADKSLKDKLLIIDFWATWCGPCLGSVPHFNELTDANKNNADLVFLSITDEKESKVSKLLEKMHFSSAVVADTNAQVFTDYRISAIPFCVMIDDKMEVKWAGKAEDLTNDMVQQFALRQPVVASTKPKAVPGTRKMYDSLRTTYNTVGQDTTVKEYFSLSPLMDEPYGSEFISQGPAIFNTVMIGKKLDEQMAKLMNKSASQIVLSTEIANAYISYCYKSTTHVKNADLLGLIHNELGLQMVTKDSLQDVITLEVTDTSRLYADLPAPTERMSRMSTTDGDKIIAMNNNILSALTPTLQNRFSCTVDLKNAAQFNRKINMTIFADDFAKFQTSIATYGIKATKARLHVKMYYYSAFKPSLDAKQR